MACNCNKKRPMIGARALPRASASTPTAAKALTASSSGAWTTTCSPDTFTSLLRAQRAARACGGRVEAA